MNACVHHALRLTHLHGFCSFALCPSDNSVFGAARIANSQLWIRLQSNVVELVICVQTKQQIVIEERERNDEIALNVCNFQLCSINSLGFAVNHTQIINWKKYAQRFLFLRFRVHIRSIAKKSQRDFQSLSLCSYFFFSFFIRIVSSWFTSQSLFHVHWKPSTCDEKKSTEKSGNCNDQTYNV